MLLDDLFSSNAQPNIDPQTMGLMGLALMNGNANPNQLMQLALQAQMLRQQPQGQQATTSDDQPQLFMQPQAQGQQLPQDTQDRLMFLKQQAEQAYPDNPTMQQVAMTQAIHESGLMGHPSQLASQYNNLFGIKSSNTNPGTAGSVDMQTQEVYGGTPQTVNAGFARNNSVADSFNQYKNLLNNHRYQSVLTAQTPAQAFQALQQSGYATDPRYANKLSNVYSHYVAPLYS
jgi:flagellar protein FlgJ